KNGDLDPDSGELGGQERGEAGVALGGGRGHVAHRLPERHLRFDVADAAPQLAGHPQGNKNGPLLAKGAARVPQIREVVAARGVSAIAVRIFWPFALIFQLPRSKRTPSLSSIVPFF